MFTLVSTETYTMPRGYKKPFSCSTHFNMEFQLLIKTKMLENIGIHCFQALRWCIFPASIVRILTFMSRINFTLSLVEHEKSFMTSVPVQDIKSST